MMPLPRDLGGVVLSLAVSVGVAAVVLVIAAFVLAASGVPFGRGMALIVAGAFGSPAAIHATLVQSGLIILTGLGAALAFRIGLYNFGAEGQLQAGTLVASGIGAVAATWPAWAILPIQLIAGASAGAAIMLATTVLRLRRGVDEGIVTLLSNFVMMLVVELVLDGRTGSALTSAAQSSFPLGLIIGLAAAMLIAIAIHITVWGFELRATAGNAAAARYAGIPIARVALRVAVASGALAGVAGVCLLADTGSAQHGGLGYTGIAVAVLARYSPIGSIAAGLFIAALMVGADLAVRAGAPGPLPDILVALTLLVSLVGLFARDRVVMIARQAS